MRSHLISAKPLEQAEGNVRSMQIGNALFTVNVHQCPRHPAYSHSFLHPQDKQQTPSKRAWEGIRKTHSPPSWVRKDLEPVQASPLELKTVEWEKAGATIPLVGQEIIDLQTEV